MVENKKETLKWLRRGAEHGNTDSQFSLGIAYLLGEGVEKGLIESYMWLELSVAGGHEEAPEFLDALAKKMDRSDVAEAQRMAREWKAKTKQRSRKAM